MSGDGTFTKHVGLAGFLHYALGPGAHVCTTADGPPTFTFTDDPPRCHAIADEFFSEESTIAGNAFQLLESMRSIRTTIGLAKNDPTRAWVPDTGETR